MTDNVLTMPALDSSTHGFHHTIDSALAALDAMGIPPSRITVQMGGLGYPSRWVVKQQPAAGTPITTGTHISLSVAGLGFFHALPVGMWDKGGEEQPGTQEIVETLDDPLQKAANWIREGARLFEVRADNPSACARWISLFGLNADDWPADMWYPLALFLPNAQHLAGKLHGINLALSLLLNLPLYEVRKVRSFRELARQHCSLLTRRYSHLSVDCVLGNRMEDQASLNLVVGPVPLKTYYTYQERDNQRLLAAVLQLCTGVHQRASVSWLVEDLADSPRLGVAEHNARLGVNSHMGRKRPMRMHKGRQL
jgi:hypothetical protein